MPVEKVEFGARLRAAFPATPLNFDGALTGGTDEGAFRNHVAGKTWTELDFELVVRRSDVLSFLAPKHLIGVLPVYLQAMVDWGGDTPVPDTLVLVLDREQEPRFDKIAKLLNDEQCAVVRDALELFAEGSSGQPAEAARQAIESWRTR